MAKLVRGSKLLFDIWNLSHVWPPRLAADFNSSVVLGVQTASRLPGPPSGGPRGAFDFHRNTLALLGLGFFLRKSLKWLNGFNPIEIPGKGHVE